MDELVRLQRKVELLPYESWKDRAKYILFSAGGFKPYLEERSREEDVILIGPGELFPDMKLSR